jgi:hypothetical protein
MGGKKLRFAAGATERTSLFPVPIVSTVLALAAGGKDTRVAEAGTHQTVESELFSAAVSLGLLVPEGSAASFNTARTWCTDSHSSAALCCSERGF